MTAAHINIQKMTAVCPACDTVFAFDLPEAKGKRRKVKQPAKLTLRDGQTLHMEFWTNFRLDRSEAVISSAIGGLTSALMAFFLLASDNAPRALPFVFFAIAAFFFYVLALTVVNKTHIEMDDDAIKVSRQPLPNPLNQGHEISLAGVTAIKYDETATSRKEAYDTPRYMVWAETADGARRSIVTDVVEEYAVFIAQHLGERLHTGDNLDVSWLEEGTNHQHDEADSIEDAPASQRSES
ncbi:MAG: hypothetical protein U0694_12060 [Anaerolineae bacterium]